MFVWFSRVWKVTAVVSALGLGALYAFQEKLLYVPKIPGMLLLHPSPRACGLITPNFQPSCSMPFFACVDQISTYTYGIHRCNVGIPDEFAAYPTEFGLEHEELWLKSADGVNLYSWHVWPSGTAPGTKLPVVLFFQENAGNMSFRLPFIALLIKHLRCAVFVLGYRGYGKSEGQSATKSRQLLHTVQILRLSFTSAVHPAF